MAIQDDNKIQFTQRERDRLREGRPVYNMSPHVFQTMSAFRFDSIMHDRHRGRTAEEIMHYRETGKFPDKEKVAAINVKLELEKINRELTGWEKDEQSSKHKIYGLDIFESRNIQLKGQGLSNYLSEKMPELNPEEILELRTTGFVDEVPYHDLVPLQARLKEIQANFHTNPGLAYEDQDDERDPTDEDILRIAEIEAREKQRRNRKRKASNIPDEAVNAREVTSSSTHEKQSNNVKR